MVEALDLTVLLAEELAEDRRNTGWGQFYKSI
jgi:hypothetical protein